MRKVALSCAHRPEHPNFVVESGKVADWESTAFWQAAADTTRGLPKPSRYTDINNAWRATFDKILKGEQAVRPAMEDLARQVDTHSSPAASTRSPR